MGEYLIPANTKKSMLILGFFTPLDLIVFGIGVTITVILLMFIKTEDTLALIGVITPALISSFLVMPIANYHNIMQLIGNIMKFLSERRTYVWKGWCIYDGK